MIQPVNSLTPRVSFRENNRNYTNPVSRKMERRLAMLNAGGLSVAIGAITTVVARSYTSGWKHAGNYGIGAALLAFMFLGPEFLYKAGIKSFAKQEEMDIFTREKEVQKKLLSDVNSGIDNNDDSLQDKLDNYSKTIAKKRA